MQGESAIRQSNDEVVKSSLRISATNEAIHKNKGIATTCILKSRNDGVRVVIATNATLIYAGFVANLAMMKSGV